MSHESGGTPEGELDRLTAELAAARAELRSCHQRMRLFVDQVSHDLRNPLTAVSMSLQLLHAHPPVAADDEACWMVDRAISGTERLDELIEELVRYPARDTD